MKIHAKDCWETQGEFWDPKMIAGRGSGEFRYWSQVPAENWWERGKWERGKLDIETIIQGWTQEVAETRSGSLDIEPKWRCMQGAVERRGLRYWNRMNAGSCGEAQVGRTLGGHGGARYKTKWKQEVVKGHREYWSKMNAGSCCGAPGRKLRY